MTCEWDCVLPTIKKRAVIAFAVEADWVYIIGVFYGGQDHESRLSNDADDVTEQ